MKPIHAPWHIRLLGDLSAQREGHEVLRFRTLKTGTVLAYLAYHLNQSHSRDELAQRFWPDQHAELSRQSLRQALTSLRRQFEPPDMPRGSVILSEKAVLQLNPKVVSTDVGRFAYYKTAAEAHQDTGERLKLLIRAANVYKGDLLPDWTEDWVLEQRDRLSLARWHVLRQIIAGFTELGKRESALDFALRAIVVQPDREEAYHDAIELYLSLDRAPEALHLYARYEDLLRREWEEEPSPRIQRLVSGIPRRAPGGAARQEPRPSLPVSLQQNRPAETQRAHTALLKRLPVTLTRLFGRHQERARLSELLLPAAQDGAHRRPPARLVTITGTGGTGKTRLSIEVARDLAPSLEDAVFFVPLEGLEDAAGIPNSILSAMRLPSFANKGAMEQIREALAGRRALVVLDNVEHLLPGAARVITSLLQEIEDLSCLVTSRMQVGIQGEMVYALKPLAVPSEEELTPSRLLEFPSVEMFVERAQALKQDFQITSRNARAIVELCGCLEGVPLAIELAAARIQVLTPEQMLPELKRRFAFLVARRAEVADRHRAFRATIEWSYEFLSPPLQRFVCSLSAFRGGWTLDAARALGDPGCALDYLDELIDRSLVVADEQGAEMRYKLPESIREFADEMLTGTERESVLARHARYYSALAERMEPQVRGAGAQYALEALEAEHQNLLRALDWHSDAGAGLSVAVNLWRFWVFRGYISLGRARLGGSLECEASAEPALRAAALAGLANLEYQEGDFEAASSHAAEGLELARRWDEPRVIAEALNMLGVLAYDRLELEPARASYAECLHLRRSVGDRVGVASSLNNLGLVALSQGDFGSAVTFFQSSVDEYRTLQDTSRLAFVLCNLGCAANEQNDRAMARASFEQSLRIATQTRNRSLEGVLRYNLGETLFREGNCTEAASYLRESILLRREVGDLAGMAHPIAVLGNIAAMSGDPYRGIKLLSASDALRKSLGTPLNPSGRAEFERDIAIVKAALTANDFRAAWSFGRGMPVEEAVRYALEWDMNPTSVAQRSVAPTSSLTA